MLEKSENPGAQFLSSYMISSLGCVLPLLQHKLVKMGCISSKPSGQQQPTDHLINPITNHHLISLVSPPKNNHTIGDVLELMAPKHDDMTTVQANTNHKKHDALARCAGFHTVEEYDELLQKMNGNNDDELSVAPVPVLDKTNSTCKKDGDVETGITRDMPVDMGNMEFRTVASLRQWLHSPGGGSGRGGDADRAADYTTAKFGFSFHDNNSNNNIDNNNDYSQAAGENLVLVETSKQPEEESIVELVAAFDKYMQQLQVDEDNILKQIHNTEWVS